MGTKRIYLLIGIACLLLAGSAATANAESKSGPIQFTAGGNESVHVAMGAKLKLDATLKLIDVGGAKAISVKGQVKNTAKEKLHYAYFVAFMDKDKNLIGCHHFVLFVDGGKQGPVGTFIQLPLDEIARIASYSVAFYESARPIGQ